MDGTPSQLWIEIDAGLGDDAEELGRVAYGLRDELLDLDVDGVQVAANEDVLAGSKGAGLLAAGGLVVRFVGHDVLKSIIDTGRSWLGRQRQRNIRLTLDGDSLELTNPSPADQDRLVDLWISRHAGN
jgi:hypothetical protein